MKIQKLVLVKLSIYLLTLYAYPQKKIHVNLNDMHGKLDIQTRKATTSLCLQV